MTIGMAILLVSGLLMLLAVGGTWYKALAFRARRKQWARLLAGCVLVGATAGIFAVRHKTTTGGGDYFGFPLPWVGWEWNWRHDRKMDFVSALSPVIAAWDFFLCIAVTHLPALVALVATRRRVLPPQTDRLQ